jgi:hypothetical protein
LKRVVDLGRREAIWRGAPGLELKPGRLNSPTIDFVRNEEDLMTARLQR